MSTYNFCPHCAQPLVYQEHGGKPRKTCPDSSCGFVHWNNPVVVLAAIVERGEEVVLVQSHGWPKHWYGVVTGFLEQSENPEAGILREVREELGLEGTLEGFIGVYSFFRSNQVILAYHVRVPARGKIQLEEAELADFKTVPIHKVIPWNAGTGPALRDWLRDTHNIERQMIPLDQVHY